MRKMLTLFLMAVFVFAMSSMASANATKSADQAQVEKAGVEVTLMIVQGDEMGAEKAVQTETAIQIMQKSDANTETARLETGGVAFIHSPTEDANADHNPDPVGTPTTTDDQAMLNSSTSATTSPAQTTMYFGASDGDLILPTFGQEANT